MLLTLFVLTGQDAHTTRRGHQFMIFRGGVVMLGSDGDVIPRPFILPKFPHQIFSFLEASYLTFLFSLFQVQELSSLRV